LARRAEVADGTWEIDGSAWIAGDKVLDVDHGVKGGFAAA
jgi:hypothetical protein